MRRHLGLILVLALLLVGALFIGIRVWGDLTADAQVDSQSTDGGGNAVAVEIAPIESGVVREIRTLSGSLEAHTSFVVVAKVNGLIESVFVDLADEVERGQVVAEIDDAEFVQAVAQAEAELAVREAEHKRAESDRNLAQRDYDRSQALKDRGIASESQLDATAAALESATAAMALAEARVQQAAAALELARIRLGYTEVRANWSGGGESATVADRYQDPGDTVQQGDPLIAVTALDPLTAVMAVTESDYTRLHVGQPATLTTDARPGETFEAEVVRIAPIFVEASRQARVELRVDNSDRLLRPGMFIRVRVVLYEADADTIVPTAAVVQRRGQNIVFTVNQDEKTVSEHVVQIGIVEGDRVQIVEPTLAGEVVVLGQQLLEDGAAITIVRDEIDDDETTEAESRG